MFVPTRTGLQKSILDAHEGVRGYLLEAGFHDYEQQSQGQTHRRHVRCALLLPDGQVETTASLYRPVTKTGDPRFWIRGLGMYASPHDLVALAVDDDRLVVMNLSRSDIRDALTQYGSRLREDLRQMRARHAANEGELLHDLRQIAASGYVRTLRPGPTGVGFTLETMLGITANSSRAPDFRGIEIKSGRRGGRSGETGNRTTLFSQTPEWKRSALNAVELLTTYGYSSDAERLQLYCTLGPEPNPQGLFLRVDDPGDGLNAQYRPPSGPDRDAVTWALAALRSSLRAKHRQTAWVKASSRGRGDDEEFRYVEVMLTDRPLASNLTPLLACGEVTVDLLMHETPAARGGIRVRDHGYLFKIKASGIPMLFPAPRTISLVSA